MELLGYYGGNVQIPSGEPIYAEATDAPYSADASRAALATFGSTGRQRQLRRSRSAGDLISDSRGDFAHRTSGHRDEPLYYILEGPGDSGTKEPALYQSLLRQGGQQEVSAAGSHYAKLDVKSRSSSVPLTEEPSADSDSGKQRRSATTSDIFISEDRCPPHSDGSVRFLSLDWRPSSRENHVESKRPISQPSASSVSRFQIKSWGLDLNPNAGSPSEGATTQPSPSPGRPGTQTGPRSKLSATLGRAGLPAGRLGVRTAGSQPDIFSPSSPLTHHRTRHEPTYVPVAVQKTTPRPLKHRRNKSDSFFLTNFRDIGRCPVESGELAQPDNRNSTPPSLSWPGNHGTILNDDETHCRVLVGNSASRAIPVDGSESSYAPLVNGTNNLTSEGGYAELKSCHIER